MNRKIGIIGAGVMAEAFIIGLSKNKTFLPQNMLANDLDEDRLEHLAGEYGITPCPDSLELVRQCDVILLAVKPQNVAEALLPLRDVFSAGKLLISIAAGVSLAALAKHLPPETGVARVMTNTPCLIGKGVSTVAFSKNIQPEQKELASLILKTVGTVHLVREKYMNAITGLSGSGPAYIYLVIEAMSDAGVRAGLPRDLSLQLSVETVIGAAAMVQEIKLHPAILKEKVTTPAGTTISALHVLERAGVRVAFMDAVMAATNRAAELGSE